MSTDKMNTARASFADRLKQKPPSVPLQQVAPVPEPKAADERGQLLVRLPKDFLREIKVRAAADGVSLQSLVEQALKAYLK